MGFGQGVTHLGEDFQGLGFGQSPGLDQGLKILPLDVFHYQEHLALILAEFVDGDDVRVVQGPGRLGFPLEADPGLPPHRGSVENALDRNLPAHERVPREPDRSHGPLADLANDLVTSELRQHGPRQVSLSYRFIRTKAFT
jgi:hypothetical protein